MRRGIAVPMRYPIKPIIVANLLIVSALLGSCGGDGPITIASGKDIEIVATSDHEARMLTINAVKEDGEVTGEFRMSDHVIRIDCADTDTDGVVILVGTVTVGGVVPPGDMLGLIIKEGDPDRVLLVGNDSVHRDAGGQAREPPR